ncbi:branched-chain amino acid ABC transporter substrate-binding protein [Chryseobacterium gambrini]|uniref:Branched-chain amino acid ABC transporter substrate-binding protein n=1 Tax=Chryseobacterium gambrini TaxID=373672 RepID=A0A1N7NHX2_9FLAO|nr:branched-chain amino acid ABC transporter substrate-binding protein [Chryseobacterium gambrini]SIS97900.1 hypothetical protein SAMN05421785_104286 [Chryseobacterium gambrini]
MNFDFLDVFGVVIDVVELLGSNSSDSNYNEKSKIEKKTKYFTEKVSAVFLFSSAVLFFFVFKDPLPSEKYVQTLIVASLIGVAISFLLFFVLHSLEKYYFKSVFQWLFFSISVLSFFISLVLWIYFKSGIFS